MEKYRYWNILEELPEGWVIDKITGSPAPKTVFITNGENILSGKQKRALLRVCKINKAMSVSKIVEQLTSFVEPVKKTEKTETPICPSITGNDLARPMNRINVAGKKKKGDDIKQPSFFDELPY